MTAYGYDSRRRQRARQDANDAAVRIRRHLTAIIALVAAAIIIIGWDQASRHINLDRPAEVPSQGHATDVTTTLSPGGQP